MMLSITWTRRVSVVAACVGLLMGCANMSGLDGTAEYGCKAPQGVQCDSVSGNYYNALQNNLPSQRQGRGADGDVAKTPSTRRQAPAPDAPPARLLPAVPASPDNALAAAVALPLRSQARVLRLWFKPWEDADRDLYDQGYVYVQIDSGRWLIDHAQQRIRDAYAPIRPPHTPSATTAPAQPILMPPKAGEPATAARPANNAPSASRSLAEALDVPTIDLP